MPDLNAATVESAMSMIAGTCRPWVVTVEELVVSEIVYRQWEGRSRQYHKEVIVK